MATRPGLRLQLKLPRQWLLLPWFLGPSIVNMLVNSSTKPKWYLLHAYIQYTLSYILFSIHTLDNWMKFMWVLYPIWWIITKLIKPMWILTNYRDCVENSMWEITLLAFLNIFISCSILGTWKYLITFLIFFPTSFSKWQNRIKEPMMESAPSTAPIRAIM